MLDATIQAHPPDLVAALAGALTFHAFGESDALIDEIGRHLSDPAITRIVFDLGRVEMIDSHWLGMFVRMLKRAQESGHAVALKRPQPAVRRLLDLVQFGRVFAIEG